MTNKTFFSEVVEDDNGELLIEIPTDLLKQMGWDGDATLDWHSENDTVILKETSNDRRDQK